MIDLSNFEEGAIFSPMQRELIKLLQKNGPMTRAEIVDMINKPRTTVYDNLIGLMTHNLVKKYSRPNNTRGRPNVFFKLIDN